MRVPFAALVLIGCGGQPPSYTCGSTEFQFKADCAEGQNRITTAFALLELFETDPAHTPAPPALVLDQACDPHDCLGAEMSELLHRLLHQTDLSRGRAGTLSHVDWDSRGYTEALSSYEGWVRKQMERHPLRLP